MLELDADAKPVRQKSLQVEQRWVSVFMNEQLNLDLHHHSKEVSSLLGSPLTDEGRGRGSKKLQYIISGEPMLVEHTVEPLMSPFIRLGERFTTCSEGATHSVTTQRP